MWFNLCLFRRPGISSVNCFLETMYAMKGALEELGHFVTIQENKLEHGMWNILYGYNTVDFNEEYKNYDYIVHQLEQLSGNEGWMTWRQGDEMKKFWANAKFIWDYSSKNLSFLRSSQYKNSRLLLHGYHERLEEIDPIWFKDIDVSFVGGGLIRREHIIRDAMSCVPLATFHWGRNLWGAERAKVFSRSKVTLNIHAYEMGIQEAARLSYLWANKIPVLSEECSRDEYPKVPQIYAHKSKLGEKLRAMLGGILLIEGEAGRCYEAFKKYYRQSTLLQPLLEELK